MKFIVRLLFAIPFAVLSVASPAQAELKGYAIITGVPHENPPDEAYKYMDANSGCQAEVEVPADTQCVVNHEGTLRSDLGPHPTQPSACVFNWDCLCGDCLIGYPGHPANYNKISTSQTNAYGKVKDPCAGGTSRDFLACTFHKAKSKGKCPDDNCDANPVNVLSRNKFQRESVYRSGSGDLDLALWANSQAGVPDFAAGAFGAHWASRYFVKVKDSLQGIVAVNRPDGKALEFRAPPSGTFYLRDADVNETLERLVDGGGATLGWRLTDPQTDGVEEFDSAGKLLLVRDRAGKQLTMTYSTGSTPPAIAPAPGLLITVTDHFGRQLNFTYNAQQRVATMTAPGNAAYAFEYDGPTGPANKKNLTKITFPDQKTRIYHYAEAAHIRAVPRAQPQPRAYPTR